MLEGLIDLAAPPISWFKCQYVGENPIALCLKFWCEPKRKLIVDRRGFEDENRVVIWRSCGDVDRCLQHRREDLGDLRRFRKRVGNGISY